mgnify:FL=1|tara:strand:+ start:6925 stop:7500 length:576 start_codon:yes stop_codon:yes gene_type:complete
MPWKYASKTLREGRGWTDDNGFKHPYNWASAWTDANKKSWGVTWEDAPASEAAFDNRFYSGRKTDGTLIEKSLTDTLWVDEDGKAIIDDMTGKQGITLGLKSAAIAQAKAEAAGLLAPHDWYVTRKAETDKAIPSDVSTYRTAVRTSCANIETAINAVKTHAKFMALYDDELNPDGTIKTVAPIRDWPDEI